MAVNDETAAAAFAALGNPARLSVLRLLVRAGCDGMNVGDLKKHLEMPASTLAHHLGALAKSGIVSQDKRGREVINSANFAVIGAISTYLTQECCAGLPDVGCE